MTFDPPSNAHLVRLIAEYPLAWVVSLGEPGFQATPLPLLGETDATGRVIALFGHFALSNPHVAVLRGSPAATILFSGPQGYISPEGISQPGWAPTWNYAVASFDVQVEFVPQENDQALERLVSAMESGRREPWTISRMGERYEPMKRRVVAFRAHVQATRGRFKLGQDETERTRAEILAQLDDPSLVRWMADFNSPAGRSSGS